MEFTKRSCIRLNLSTAQVALIDCKSLNSKSNTVEFVTSELIGNSATLHITDERGNFTTREFSIDIASLLPPEIVSIPDANLAAAIQSNLGLAPGHAITQLDMLNLNPAFWFWGHRSPISDVTGLEHAVNLESLGLRSNKISDLRPLAGLTKLRELSLAYNQISDITPLAGLVNLEEFHIEGNPLATIPNRGTVDLLLSSDTETIIESRKFTIYSVYNGRIRQNPADPVTVKFLNFDALLHSDKLAGFFDHGGMIELLTLADADFGDVVISEIMWGLNGNYQWIDQWIELYRSFRRVSMLKSNNMATPKPSRCPAMRRFAPSENRAGLRGKKPAAIIDALSLKPTSDAIKRSSATPCVPAPSANQQTETRLGCAVLNRMLRCAKPESYPITNKA